MDAVTLLLIGFAIVAVSVLAALVNFLTATKRGFDSTMTFHVIATIGNAIGGLLIAGSLLYIIVDFLQKVA